MSKSEDRNSLDCAAMERMSTSGLEELLRRDFHSLEDGETGPGELYRAAQVLAERERRSAAAVDRAWERFREKYLPFAKDGSSPYEDGGMPSSDAVPGRRHSPARRRTHGSFQKDGGDPVPYEAGGITHLLTTNAGMPSALWVNGPAECAASGNITMEELKRMIDSIYE